MDDVRFVLVADDPLVRTGLAALLEPEPGLALAAQVASGGCGGNRARGRG